MVKNPSCSARSTRHFLHLLSCGTTAACRAYYHYMLKLLSHQSSRRSSGAMLYCQLLHCSTALAARRPRASWHPSKISLIFRTFAKTDLGILQENPNVLPLLTWHPSKPRNIHAGLLTHAAPKNTPFLPPNPADLGILHQNPNVLPVLSWRPSKPRNSHACLLTAKLSKNTAFSPAHTTTWRPSKITNDFMLSNLAMFKTPNIHTLFLNHAASKASNISALPCLEAWMPKSSIG